jgi:hypothetical protein
MRQPSHPWTLVQGFYAQMGGYVLDTTGIYPGFLPEIRTTLDLRSFRFLLRHAAMRFIEPNRRYRRDTRILVTLPGPLQQHILLRDLFREEELEGEENQAWTSSSSDICEGLDISQSYISDKSKASGLAKAIVCIQSLWFCIQALSRVFQRLPITLLELNTFAHSICALIIYVLWWHKLLDVKQATSLPVRDAQAIRIWAFLHRGKYFQDLGHSPKAGAEISKIFMGILRQIKSWFHKPPRDIEPPSYQIQDQVGALMPQH